MKNIIRTIRTLNVECPVKTETGFETRTATVIDTGVSAIRAELKKQCAAAGIKFLGEYNVLSAEERTFSMPVEMFVEYANVIG